MCSIVCTLCFRWDRSMDSPQLLVRFLSSKYCWKCRFRYILLIFISVNSSWKLFGLYFDSLNILLFCMLRWNSCYPWKPTARNRKSGSTAEPMVSWWCTNIRVIHQWQWYNSCKPFQVLDRVTLLLFHSKLHKINQFL